MIVIMIHVMIVMMSMTDGRRWKIKKKERKKGMGIKLIMLELLLIRELFPVFHCATLWQICVIFFS